MRLNLASLAAIGCLGTITALSGAQAAVQSNPGYVTAAVADASRPQADKDRDPLRKPAALVTFAGVKPGDKVADLLPGGGYFTRIFSKVVGPNGKVYAIGPKESDGLKALVAESGYSNVTSSVQPLDKLSIPEPLDVAWTSQNYHDLKNAGATEAVNKAVFAALKPGGVYIVIDHAAASGSGPEVSKDLHRIDPETVRKEVTAAGFVLDSQSDVLKNTADPHTAKVFDPSIRGRTDQFVFKFKKPAR